MAFVSCASVALSRVETILRLLRLLPRLAQARRALALERPQPLLFALLVRAILLERRLERDEAVLLAFHLVVQLLDARHQRAIVKGEEMQILVPSDELAERARREHGFRRVQRAALVDVDQPFVQGELLRVQLVLRSL